MNYYGQFNGQVPPPPVFFQPDTKPGFEEKRKIRRNYNVIGAVLLTLYILTNVICIVLYSVFCPNVNYNDEGIAVYGIKDMLIGGCVPAVMAMIVFIGYCAFSRYDPRELFRTGNINKGQVFKYVLIVLGMQQTSAICNVVFSNVLYFNGLEVISMNYEIEHTAATYAADLLGAVLLAPIGEELIYRGVVLRCASKVSQRFAIFFSAFIFGIMHGNPYQFILGFLTGIPMAIITVKSGSLIPSIICHISNNVIAAIPSVAGYFDEGLAEGLNIFIILPLFLILGIAMLIIEISSGRMKLPEYTEFHSKRTLPILITSWSMIVITVFYVLELVSSVRPIPEAPEAPEMIGESVRLFVERILL